MALLLSDLFQPRTSRHVRVRSESDEEADDQRQNEGPRTQQGGEGLSSSDAETSAMSVETVPTPASPGNEPPRAAATEVTVDEETGGGAEAGGSNSPANTTDVAAADDAANVTDPANPSVPLGQQDRLRTYLTQRRLVELEEERELRRRRQSTCTLVVVFVLFRLWVEALAEGDAGLMLICLLGTSWTVRWVRSRREEEEEMDRAIETFVREAASGGVGADGAAANAEGGRTMTAAAAMGTVPPGVTVDAADLRYMSFQAQLALAILESQRQVMEGGGHGHPDGAAGANSGVSDEARGRWSRYSFRGDEGPAEEGDARSRSSSPVTGAGRRGKIGRRSCGAGGYGSVSSTDDDDNGVRLEVMEEGGAGAGGSGGRPLSLAVDEDENSLGKTKEASNGDGSLGGSIPGCSICLGDYEEGERLVQLPCGHIYHEECVTAWVSNHVRCPLCNFDLEANTHEGVE